MLSVPHERCVRCLKAPAYAGVRGQTTSDQPTKHSSASVPSVVFRHKTLCFLFIPPSRRAGCFFLPSEVADILPSSLFDKQKGFKDLFHPFNIYTPEVIMNLRVQHVHRQFKHTNLRRKWIQEKLKYLINVKLSLFNHGLTFQVLNKLLAIFWFLKVCSNQHLNSN